MTAIQQFRTKYSGTGFAVLLITVMTAALVTSPPIFAAIQRTVGLGPAAQAYKQSLKSQVDTADGRPRDGRNPATQAQTSLFLAASNPNGTGTRTDKPAAGVVGDHHSHVVKPSDVLGDAAKTGINSAGCYVNYGRPGEQCLQAGVADNLGALGCTTIRMKFPNGLSVNGTDRLNLDHNHDGIACGPKD
jgi:hypothetical protein